jgi:hypothetical protein
MTMSWLQDEDSIADMTLYLMFAHCTSMFTVLS